MLQPTHPPNPHAASYLLWETQITLAAKSSYFWDLILGPPINQSFYTMLDDQFSEKLKLLQYEHTIYIMLQQLKNDMRLLTTWLEKGSLYYPSNSAETKKTLTTNAS